MLKPVSLAAALTALPLATATAHPHVFVTVEVAVIYDGAAPIGVQLDWIYDQYFSLLLTTDIGVDLDGDMALTAQEAETLNDYVTEWPADYAGDLEVTQNDTVLRLGQRQSHTATYENGVIRERHIRPLIGAADDTLTVRVFDPFYYVDYQLSGPIRFSGNDSCSATVIPPDLNSAYSLVDELLYGRPASDVGPEENFPEVGSAFAETIVITCAG